VLHARLAHSECGYPLEIGLSMEPLEGRSGAIELERRGVVVTESSARETDERACPRDLVRGFELLPHVGGAPKRRERSQRVVASQ
jgi:hypothetical protein